MYLFASHTSPTNGFAGYFQSTAALFSEPNGMQVWVGFDIHWLLNNRVICALGPSEEGFCVAGNCCGGRLGFVLGRAALPLSCTLRSPSPLAFHPHSIL